MDARCYLATVIYGMLDYTNAARPSTTTGGTEPACSPTQRPDGWHEEVAELVGALRAGAGANTSTSPAGPRSSAATCPARTGLDAAPPCARVGISIAGERLAHVVAGDALAPVGSGRLVRARGRGSLLRPPARRGTPERSSRDNQFKARGLAPALVIDSARREDEPAERIDPRVLDDGSRHEVYKRWFEPRRAVAELGGGVVPLRPLVRGGCLG